VASADDRPTQRRLVKGGRFRAKIPIRGRRRYLLIARADADAVAGASPQLEVTV
jgi:hypothetical protein